jgi:hypothetical protein
MSDEFILVDVGAVRVLARYVLELTLDTGETRVIDVEDWLTGEMFEPLVTDYTLFKQMRVDPDAGTIVWPNGADLSPMGALRRIQTRRPSLTRRAPIDALDAPD